jgi:hypothetical protein
VYPCVCLQCLCPSPVKENARSWASSQKKKPNPLSITRSLDETSAREQREVHAGFWIRRIARNARLAGKQTKELISRVWFPTKKEKALPMMCRCERASPLGIHCRRFTGSGLTAFVRCSCVVSRANMLGVRFHSSSIFHLPLVLNILAPTLMVLLGMLMGWKGRCRSM